MLCVDACVTPLCLSSALILICGATWVAIGNIPSELEPQEDRGALMVRVTAPEGTGFSASLDYMGRVTEKLNRLVESGEARHVLAMTPGGRNSAGAVNSGQRHGRARAVGDSATGRRHRSRGSCPRTSRAVIGVRAVVIQPPGLTRFFGQPIQFVIGGPTYEDLVKWRDIMLEKARQYPGLYAVDADYKETTPQYRVVIDRDRAAELGVTSEIDRAHAPDHARLARGDDVRGPWGGIRRRPPRHRG